MICYLPYSIMLGPIVVHAPRRLHQVGDAGADHARGAGGHGQRGGRHVRGAQSYISKGIRRQGIDALL